MRGHPVFKLGTRPNDTRKALSVIENNTWAAVAVAVAGNLLAAAWATARTTGSMLREGLGVELLIARHGVTDTVKTVYAAALLLSLLLSLIQHPLIHPR